MVPPSTFDRARPFFAFLLGIISRRASASLFAEEVSFFRVQFRLFCTGRARDQGVALVFELGLLIAKSWVDENQECSSSGSLCLWSLRYGWLPSHFGNRLHSSLQRDSKRATNIEKACAHRFFATVWRGNARRGSSTRLLYMDFLAIRLLEGKQEGRAF